jgi:hypothetical protein
MRHDTGVGIGAPSNAGDRGVSNSKGLARLDPFESRSAFVVSSRPSSTLGELLGVQMVVSWSTGSVEPAPFGIFRPRATALLLIDGLIDLWTRLDQTEERRNRH